VDVLEYYSALIIKQVPICMIAVAWRYQPAAAWSRNPSTQSANTGWWVAPALLSHQPARFAFALAPQASPSAEASCSLNEISPNPSGPANFEQHQTDPLCICLTHSTKHLF